MTGIRLAGFMVILGLGMGLAGASSAAPVTWSFSGQITELSSDSAETLDTLSSLGVSVGSPFFGELVFESTSVDEDPIPTIGHYPGAILSLFVTIGAFHEEVIAGAFLYSSVTVLLDDPLNFQLGRVIADGQGAGADGIFDDPILQLDVIERTPGEITSDALPLFPPALYTEPYEELRIFGAEAAIYGTLTQIALVPEPQIGVLVAFAALGLVAARRR